MAGRAPAYPAFPRYELTLYDMHHGAHVATFPRLTSHGSCVPFPGTLAAFLGCVLVAFPGTAWVSGYQNALVLYSGRGGSVRSWHLPPYLLPLSDHMASHPLFLAFARSADNSPVSSQLPHA